MYRIGIDTETTGVDLYHGAKPFLVTICDDNCDQWCWEWPVDPETRDPQIPPEDIEEIKEKIEEADLIVIQNSKFDVRALETIGIMGWSWEKTVDTLIAGHLLASGHAHDLTSMGIEYCGVNIESFELEMEAIVKKARNRARSKYKTWRIAKKQEFADDATELDMPSAKDKAWKFDMWLPKEIAEREGYPDDHPWRHSTRDYANVDSGLLLPLYDAQRKLMEERKLTKIFDMRNKLPEITHGMESKGITLSGKRLDELMEKYTDEEEHLGRVCVNLAKSYDYDLTLPKSGNNNSLLHFCFGRKESVDKKGNVIPSGKWLDMPHTPYKTDTGNPSLSGKAIEFWESTLEPRSKQLTFVRSLGAKRKRSTARQYMAGYRRFWKPYGAADQNGAGWYVLHPQLNPTGTYTLRWSSKSPNEQNISKKEDFNLRYMFGPAPGREWVSMDAKNIELRIPAYESGEQELIDLFERPDEAPYFGSNHLLIFHTLHPDKWALGTKEVGPDKAGAWCKKTYASTWYQWTKNGNFAVQYGAVDTGDDDGTADRAYHVPGAQKRIAARFQKQEKLNQDCIRYAEKYGYVETMPDKTVDPERGYPIQCTRTFNGRIKPTVPLNYHVQSTAMWWMCKAMIRCEEQLKEWRSEGYDCHLVMQVHDELVFDFPKSERPGGKLGNMPRYRKLKRLMEMGGDDIGVPTPVSIEYHANNWSEGVTV